MIVNIITQTIGDTDNSLRSVFITTTSTYDEVIAPGFIIATRNNQFYTTDTVNVFYDYNDESKSGTIGQFIIKINNNVITLVPINSCPIISVTGTSKTLSLVDQCSIQDCSNESAQTITVPAFANVPFSYGNQILFKRSGVGSVTFAAAEGVTIQSDSGHLKIASQYDHAYLIPMSQNLFWLYGSLSA